MKKLKTFDLSYFIGKSHCEEDSTQNYLVFQPLYRYFNQVSGVGSGNYIYSWKSKGLFDENITAPTTSDYKPNPELSCFGTKTRVEVKGNCLKQHKVTFNHGKVVNIYTVYEISNNYPVSTYSTLEKFLFGAVSLTENADINRCKYSRYGIGLDSHGSFSFPGIGLGRNVIIFGIDMSSSVHVDNKKKDIFILGKGPTQGLEYTLTAEKMYLINLTEHNKKMCLGLHYNGASSYLFVNGKDVHKFKAKDSEIVATPLYLGNISKNWSIDNMKQTGLNGYVYDFSVDYSDTALDATLDIHNYLMKKDDII